ncbi:MAG: hypothetical protein OJF62_000939 [Pseudolabrys sp.]|nr:hypothetical protein [Pseudolabrys sp.]
MFHLAQEAGPKYHDNQGYIIPDKYHLVSGLSSNDGLAILPGNVVR